MKFLREVWKFVNSKIFGYILIAVILIFFVGTCGRMSKIKEDGKRKDQNISALTDSINTVTLKNGEIQSSRDAYMADYKELKEYNVDLAFELKSQRGKVVTLNRIVFQLRQDTADLQAYINELLTKYKTPERVNDSTWNVDWQLAYTYDSTNYDIFNGRTQIGIRAPQNYLKDINLLHNRTQLLNRNSQISLTWGQKWEDTGKNKKLRVYAQTAHPAFQTQLLEGTYVDYPKKRHWFTGFGVGPALNLGYDFLNNQPVIVVGVGIHYSIYQW